MNNINTYFILVLFCVFAGATDLPGVLDKGNLNYKIQPDIEFVKAIHSDLDFNLKPTFTTKVKNLLFGKESNSMIRPVSVVVSKFEQLYTLDQGRQSLLLLNHEHKKIKNVQNYPSLVSACLDLNSNILFTDSQLNKIFLFNISKEKIIELNSQTLLNRPTGIACLSRNNEIWVVETGAHRIAVLDLSGKLIRYIGERGIEPGQFNFPTAIWVDKQDKVYIIDSMNYRVQIFNAEGMVTSSFGEQGDGSGYFGRPRSIACDSYGHIYVVDALFHTVQIFDDKGKFLSYFGGQGKEPGQFWMPSGIFIDKQNIIYVADTYNARIQKFRLNRKDTHDSN